MLFTHKIDIDLNKLSSRQRRAVAYGTKDAVAVEISLWDGDEPWEIPQGTTCVIRYMKANGNGGVYHTISNGSYAWKIDGSKMTLMLIPEMLDVPGLVDVSVAMVNSNRTLCIYGFDIHVDSNLIMPLEETGDLFEFGTLTEINTAIAALQMKTDVDSTLSVTGRPADAAATGAALGKLSNEKLAKSGGEVSGWFNFGNTNNGFRWTTDDGTVFQIRPYVSNNILQIIRIDTDGAVHAVMNMNNAGQVTFGEKALPVGSGGTGAMTVAEARANLDITPKNIGALDKKWDCVSAAANGVLTDANLISIDTADGQYNAPKLVTSDTTNNMPSDCAMGVRTVQWHSESCIVARIDGIATDGTVGVWLNVYNGSSWKVWKRLDTVLESTTYKGCYYRYVNSVIEWMNPPMVLGTEYKTVERWQGKAVYTKLVTCGTIPADGQKTVAHGASATCVIRCLACADDGSSLPYFYYPTSIDVMATTTQVQIYAQNRTEGGNAYVQIWYTKD